MLNIIYRFLTLIYPPKCVLCRTVLPPESNDLCVRCRKEAPEFVFSKKKIPHTAGWISLWLYKDHVRKSILRYKFAHNKHYAKAYGRLLAMRIITGMDEEFDVVTWVTPSIRRQLVRGFDHGRKLAKATAKELGLPLQRTLTKAIHNPAQSASFSAAERRANVLGVYKPFKPTEIAGKRILLIDDVVTTGATASECAKTLMLSGAKSVHVATVATTELPYK